MDTHKTVALRFHRDVASVTRKCTQKAKSGRIWSKDTSNSIFRGHREQHCQILDCNELLEMTKLLCTVKRQYKQNAHLLLPVH